MCSPRRFAIRAGLVFVALFPIACGVAGGEGLSDGSGARYPDARVGDAGRMRTRDATTQPDAQNPDGGSTADADAATPGNYTWYGDIEAIVHARCGTCHTNPPQFGAPRSLMFYRDVITTNAFGQPVFELMSYRLVASTGKMPPDGQPEATAAEVQMILDWAAAGAPMGPEPADSGVVADAEIDAGVQLPWSDGGLSPSPGPGLRYVDMWAHAENDYGTGYTAVRGLDGTSYICWGIDLPANPNPNAMPESVVTFEPFVDNYRHVHHIFAYIGDPAQTIPDGPWDCILGGRGRIIGSWFPGRGDTDLPTGTGVPVTAGMRLNMQLHYDSVMPQGALDMSGIRLLLTEQQGLITAGEMWAGIDWEPIIGAPPGGIERQSVVTNDLDDLTIFTATPHMHGRGEYLLLEYRFATDPLDTWRVLKEQARWDFNNQVLYDINPPVVLNIGDQMRTTCRWTTDDGPIIQGQSSDNEMCYWFLYHYRTLGANPALQDFYYFVGEATADL